MFYWTAKRSNQSILKEINPEYSLEGLMLKLKLQCFGHMMKRVNSLEKTLMLGKIEGKRRKGQQRIWWIDSVTSSMDMNFSKLWKIVKNRKAWCAASMGSQKVKHDLATKQQQLLYYINHTLQNAGSKDSDVRRKFKPWSTVCNFRLLLGFVLFSYTYFLWRRLKYMFLLKISFDIF